MAQIQCPADFVPLQQVTAANLNAHVNNAILLPGAIESQIAISANTVASVDTILIHDDSASALRKATAADLLASGLPIVTDLIAGAPSADLTIVPSAGQKVDVLGNFKAVDIESDGNLTVDGTINVTGSSTMGATSVSSLTIDGKTPMTTQDNLVKVYVKKGVASGATGGGSVENLVYQTPVLPAIPADETWIYEFWVQTTSGYVNGNTRADYNSVRLLVYNNATLVDTIRGSTSPYGGHTATHTYATQFTSADVSPRLILKTSNTWGLNEEPRFMVRLTKVKTSTLADETTCI